MIYKLHEYYLQAVSVKLPLLDTSLRTLVKFHRTKARDLRFLNRSLSKVKASLTAGARVRARVGFVVDKVALGQVSLRLVRGLLSVSFYRCTTLIYHPWAER
jgi:hypothetical protein